MNMTETLKTKATTTIKLLAVTGALVFGAKTAEARPHHGPDKGVAIAHEVAHGVAAVAGLVAAAQGNAVVVGTPAPVIAAPVVAQPVVAAPVVAQPVVAQPVVAAPVVAAPIVAPAVVPAPVMAPMMPPPGMNANQWRKMQRRMNLNYGPNENTMRKIERRMNLGRP